MEEKKWGAKDTLVTKPEKVQLIQPPMAIMGSMLVSCPLSISTIMLGSVMG